MADLELSLVEAAAPAAARADESPAEVMKQFISLGQNCEFGFAQRAHGAEPLDLLRWASTPLPVLIDLLRNRFAGIGDPEQIRVYHPPGREFMVEHTGYRFIWHAFAKEGEITAEELKRRECRRLPRLAEMMVDHLTDGRRIGVIKYDNGLTPDRLAPLLAAMRSYGSCPLLLVHETEDVEKIATATDLGNGLLLGYVRRFSDPADVPATTDATTWLHLCHSALATLRNTLASDCNAAPNVQNPHQNLTTKAVPIVEAPSNADSLVRSWVAREVAYWRSLELDYLNVKKKIRERHEIREMEFLFEIRDGQVNPAYKAPATPDRVPIWRPPLYESLLKKVVDKFEMNLDIDLLLSVADGGLGRESIPIFSFQRSTGSNALLLPDVDFLSFDFYRSRGDFEDHLAYHEKECSAVFVGSTTGARLTKDVVQARGLPRLRSALYFRNNHRVDFRLPVISNATDDAKELLVEMGFGRGNRLSWKEQFQHKFIISMDGFGATCSRLPIVLKSNSVLLKYVSNDELFYFPGLRPWVHYIPIEKDSDVDLIVSAEEKHPGSFAHISHNAREFAKNYLNEDIIERYTALLIRSYADLFSKVSSRSMTYLAPTQHRDNQEIRTPFIGSVVHYSELGDVWSVPNDGPRPDMPYSRVEGFALDIHGPLDGSEIEYQCVMADGSLSEIFRNGSFCGTRGAGLPIYGLAAKLIGPLSRDWGCQYSAEFVSGLRVGPFRQGQVCKGGDGEPLRHFEVSIIPKTEGNVTTGDPDPTSAPSELIIDFSRDGAAGAFLRDGWSGQERSHIWAIGETSTLSVVGLCQSVDWRLFLDVAPHLRGPHASHAELEVYVNGGKVSEFLVSYKQRIECTVARQLLRPNGAQLILFRHPSYARPSDYGIDDDRPLAFAFFRAIFSPIL